MPKGFRDSTTPKQFNSPFLQNCFCMWKKKPSYDNYRTIIKTQPRKVKTDSHTTIALLSHCTMESEETIHSIEYSVKQFPRFLGLWSGWENITNSIILFSKVFGAVKRIKLILPHRHQIPFGYGIISAKFSLTKTTIWFFKGTDH